MPTLQPYVTDYMTLHFYIALMLLKCSVVMLWNAITSYVALLTLFCD